jgi:hypothetical protein
MPLPRHGSEQSSLSYEVTYEQTVNHELALDEVLNHLLALGFFLSIADETKLNLLPMECDAFERYGQLIMLLSDSAVFHKDAWRAQLAKAKGVTK